MLFLLLGQSCQVKLELNIALACPLGAGCREETLCRGIHADPKPPPRHPKDTGR